jgi:hypothetical protein
VFGLSALIVVSAAGLLVMGDRFFVFLGLALAVGAAVAFALATAPVETWFFGLRQRTLRNLRRL